MADITTKELLGKIIKKRKKQRFNITNKFKNKLKLLLKEDIFVGTASEIFFECSSFSEQNEVKRIVSILIPSAKFNLHPEITDLFINIDWLEMEKIN